MISTTEFTVHDINSNWLFCGLSFAMYCFLTTVVDEIALSSSTLSCAWFISAAQQNWRFLLNIRLPLWRKCFIILGSEIPNTIPSLHHQVWCAQNHTVDNWCMPEALRSLISCSCWSYSTQTVCSRTLLGKLSSTSVKDRLYLMPASFNRQIKHCKDSTCTCANHFKKSCNLEVLILQSLIL